MATYAVYLRKGNLRTAFDLLKDKSNGFCTLDSLSERFRSVGIEVLDHIGKEIEGSSVMSFEFFKLMFF